MRHLFGCPDIISLTEKFWMARNFFRIFTENNPELGTGIGDWNRLLLLLLLLLFRVFLSAGYTSSQATSRSLRSRVSFAESLLSLKVPPSALIYYYLCSKIIIIIIIINVHSMYMHNFVTFVAPLSARMRQCIRCVHTSFWKVSLCTKIFENIEYRFYTWTS